MKSQILFLMCVLFLGLLPSFHIAISAESTGPAILNLNEVKEGATVVLFGTVESASAPFEVLGKSFYRIHPESVLKGRFDTNGFLVVVTAVDSSEGIPPAFEPRIPYALFLRETKLQESDAPTNVRCYALVGNWKGVVALDKRAAEVRAVRNMAKHCGIDIQDGVEDFKQALRYSLSLETVNQPLSERGSQVYRQLKLKQPDQ